MSTNPDHINQLAAIIREVDDTRMIASAAERAEAILSHPGWPWQPPAALVQPEGEGPSERIISIAKAVQESAWGWEPDGRLIGNVCAKDVADLCSAVLARWGHPATSPAPEVIEAAGNCARIELVVALHALVSQFENETAAFTGDDLKAVQGHVKHARKIAAKHNRNGPGCAPATLPANYIDPEHQGETLELLQTFYQACNAEGGTADEIHLRGLRAVLAARPTTPPAREASSFDPRLIALATTSEQIPPGLYSEHELRTEWDAQDPRCCNCGALWRDVPIRLDEGQTQRGNGNGGPTTPKPPIKPQPHGGRLIKAWEEPLPPSEL
jgi:hypothetical protein